MLKDSDLNLNAMLENGMHLGHHKKKWNPNMSSYIYGVRNNNHIIDLEQTLFLLRRAMGLVEEVSRNRGTVLFVSTSNITDSVIKDTARYINQPFICKKWIGGLLTNWKHVSKMKDTVLDPSNSTGFSVSRGKRMRIKKLNAILGGIKDLNQLPSLVIVPTLIGNEIVIKECCSMGIPVIGISDTNANPSLISYPIPANDDSLKSVTFCLSMLAIAFERGLR